jgi:hypothetical protein
MIISFIGNCQTVSLCFYFQQLLDYDIYWLLYGNEFRPHVGNWAKKVNNKILDYNEALNIMKKSDIIIYQEICKEKSQYFNTAKLLINKKESCQLIKIPSIHLDYSNYNISLKQLIDKETLNNVNITVSDIFEKYRHKNLMITICHPNTFLFLELVDKLCKLLNINTFSELKRDIFLQDNNYMKLP